MPISAGAAEVADLYSAEVSVASQDSQERDEAIRAAMAAVLVKSTGRRDIANLPAVAPILRTANTMVEQYRYREVARIDGAAGASPAAPEYKLWVAFDADAIQHALEQAELPIWGSTRPIILLWLAVQDGAQRYLLDPSVHQPTVEVAQSVANERALPLVFPLMDLEDQSRIGISEVWGNFSDTILAASQRYNVDGVLVGRLHREVDGRWYGRWSLYQNDAGIHWDGSGVDMEAALAEGVNVQADRLAARFAQVFSRNVQDQVRLVVYQVDDFGDYGRALTYLQSLNPVKSIHVASLDGDRVGFDVSLRGSREGLRQVIGLGNVLVPVDIFQQRVNEANGAQPQSESEWTYQIK